MPGRIEIHRRGVPVAIATWTGTRAAGEAQIRAAGDGQEEAVRQLNRAIADRRDLRRVRFVTDRASVTGWRGFDGFLAGLTVVLPVLGMDVGAIDWPDQPETV